MSENQTQERDGPRHEPAAGFRLRPERPRVMRLSRKVLAGLATVASIAILGSLIWALDTRKRSQQSGQELFNTDNKTTPDGLASLPKDYTGLPPSVPQLGPPLPGDLGRPILNAHSAGLPASGFETMEQRMAQESEAARTSRLFSTTSAVERPEIGSALAAVSAATGTAAADQKPPLDPNSLQNMQDRKLAFLNGPADRRTVSSDRLMNPDLPQSIAYAEELKERGADWVTASSGGISPLQKITTGPGYQLPFAEGIRQGARVNTVAVGLITGARQAEDIVASGKADLVALARAMLYDPRWPWHAAAELGATVDAPPPYWRAPPREHKDLFGNTVYGAR